MKPIEFEEQTNVLGCPQGMSEEECGGLPVMKLNTSEGNHLGLVSCWELSDEEFQTICKNGGKIWLTVHGNGHPVVNMTAEKPFHTPGENVQD